MAVVVAAGAHDDVRVTVGVDVPGRRDRDAEVGIGLVALRGPGRALVVETQAKAAQPGLHEPFHARRQRAATRIDDAKRRVTEDALTLGGLELGGLAVFGKGGEEHPGKLEIEVALTVACGRFRDRKALLETVPVVDVAFEDSAAGERGLVRGDVDPSGSGDELHRLRATVARQPQRQLPRDVLLSSRDDAYPVGAEPGPEPLLTIRSLPRSRRRGDLVLRFGESTLGVRRPRGGRLGGLGRQAGKTEKYGDVS